MSLPSGLVSDFCQEAQSLLERVEKCLRPLEGDLPLEAREALCRPIQRHLHTLKGNAGFIGAESLQRALHRIEDFAEGLAQNGDAASSLVPVLSIVRAEIQAISAGRSPTDPSPPLEKIARGELFVTEELIAVQLSDEGARVSRERLDELLAATSDLWVRHAQVVEKVASSRPLREAVESLMPAIRRLQELALEVRVETFAPLLHRLDRVVRDEARRSGKQITLTTEGSTVEVDKAVLEVAASCLVHLIRNAVAHGIEAPEVRVAAGKPPEGTVTISIAQHSESVRVVVTDDGRGLDVDAIRARAVEQGLDRSRPPEALIFDAGLSTSPVGQLSGRGIGLDAVQAVARAAGGTIDVTSSPGRGCAFGINLPASLALQRALVVELGGERYALPAVSVFRAARTRDLAIRQLGERRWVEHGGGLVPLIDTGAELGVSARTAGYAVLFEANGVGALEVDGLGGEQELVFRPLESQWVGSSPVSGATLSSSGAVLLRLDPARLIAATHQQAPSVGAEVRR